MRSNLNNNGIASSLCLNEGVELAEIDYDR